jgi:hypothetical protein
MKIDKFDPNILDLTENLENKRFYDALQILVDILTESKDQSKILLYFSIFVYQFNKTLIWDIFGEVRGSEKRSEENKQPMAYYSTLSSKFSPPYMNIVKLVDDHQFSSYLYHIASSIAAYCQNQIGYAIEEMKTAKEMGLYFELPDYYLAVYYSKTKNHEQFLQHYNLLSVETQSEGFSKKFTAYRPDFHSDPTHMIQQFNKELLKLRARNEEMVRRYSHNWSNLLLPHAIQEVVKVLWQTNQFKNEAMLLRRAYQNETLLSQQSVMLQLRHSDNHHQVQTHIRKGIANSEHSNSIMILDIIRESLEIVLFKIFFSDSRSRTQREQRILDDFEWCGIILEEVSSSLAELMVQDQSPLLQWVNDNLVPLKISVNSEWEKVRLLKEDGGAYALLIEVFTELFKNALTYGKKGDKSCISLSLSDATFGEMAFLKLTMTNETDQGLKSIGTEHGLSSLDALLQLTNCDLNGKQVKEKYVESSSSSGQYSVDLWIKQNLLLREGIYGW